MVELPPGAQRTGSLGIPEQGLSFRFRVRAVVRHQDASLAARAAIELGGRLAARFLDREIPLAGTGWEVTNREQIADGGADVQGGVANHTADFEALISKA